MGNKEVKEATPQEIKYCLSQKVFTQNPMIDMPKLHEMLKPDQAQYFGKQVRD